MQFESGILVLVFLILALFIGALTRHVLKNTQIPYTVALLVIGICIGLAQRGDVFSGDTQMVGDTLALVADIDPHLFLFLFLPTLIFESAFAMEVHLFRRMFTQIAILAVPGLMLAIWLTAELLHMSVPEHWQWSWAMCLMFGALISATDPVAVVALLKEVSSRKRLETLIEGESLLNDGTAIVFFSLFYVWVLASSGGEGAMMASPLQAVGQFAGVVLVGLAIGLVLGGLCIIWIDRVFNDPMIEITLTIAAAYSAFFISESFHVSGVVAVVTLALVLASVGRTRISPEVAGFLHHFWEMMAHIANTCIFLLVGILVAIRVPLDDLQAWQTLGILYVGIMLIRATSITVFTPLLSRIGVGITFEKASVLCWGGLRGAVSLALALTVAASEAIPKEISDRMLFLCAGIVVLTILINGGTMGMLLKFLRLDSLPPAKQATVDKANQQVANTLQTMLPTMMDSPFLRGADWQQVKTQVKLGAMAQTDADAPIDQSDLDTAFLRRLLETERKHYWTQFEQGTLGKRATNLLVEAVELALDGEPCIGQRDSLLATWQVPGWLERMRGIAWLERTLLRLYFERLVVGYDVARGFIQAQEALESHIDTLSPNAQIATQVRQQVQDNMAQTIARINELQETFPDIVQALQSQAAIRLLLNRERAVIKEQLKLAVLDKPEASRLLEDVEKRMAALQQVSIFRQTEAAQLDQQIPWLHGVTQSTREQISSCQERGIYDVGQVLIRQGKALNKLGVIYRGSVREVVAGKQGNSQVVVRGPGETLGITALLTGSSALDYLAETPCEVVWIPVDKLKALMQEDPTLMYILCQQLAQR
ncbi:cation:proton antiporter [Pseudoalteromonas rubra]|uniref:cation:proton antiporter domain-containing protein n=1 Tax=Pseudoalteromonas rubra TaxID=43658 RepID=UPI000F7A25E9|nr:cation:proton antiporter [Pseudoalteromonas rubra]